LYLLAKKEKKRKRRSTVSDDSNSEESEAEVKAERKDKKKKRNRKESKASDSEEYALFDNLMNIMYYNCLTFLIAMIKGAVMESMIRILRKMTGSARKGSSIHWSQ